MPQFFRKPDRGERYAPVLCSIIDSRRLNAVDERASNLFFLLLAACDDFGLYYADPQVITGKLYCRRHELTHEDRAEFVRKALEDLANVDLIRLYEIDGEKYLWIVNCVKTFRSDYNTASRYPIPSHDLLSSERIPLGVRAEFARTPHDCERSPSEFRSLKTDTETETETKTKTEEALPPGLDSTEFRSAWIKWKRHRSEIRKPLKPTQEKESLGKLAKIGPDRAIAMVEHTIAMGWQGLREPEIHKDNGRNMAPGSVYDQNAGKHDANYGKM